MMRHGQRMAQGMRGFCGQARLVALVWALMAGLLACKGASDTSRPGSAGSSEAADAGRRGDAGDSEDPGRLAPVIRAVGAPGVVPQMVAIEFSRPLVSDTPRVADPALTRFEIDPAVEGVLSFVGPASLTFVPHEGFEPGKTYQVRLKSVESPELAGCKSGEGPCSLEPPQPWEHAFTTPPFGFVALSRGILYQDRRRMSVDVAFSAPVSPADVARRTTWQLDGRVVKALSHEAGGEAHVVRFVLPAGARTSVGAKLSMSLEAGVVHAGRASLAAAAARGDVALLSGPAVKIHTSVLEESGAGFFVQVICSDDAVGGEPIYVWNEQSYDSFVVSPRCVLDEAHARESIRLEPAVPFSLAAARGGFRILAPLERGAYTLTIEAGARTEDGGLLHETYRTTLQVPARRPMAAFVARGRYLPKEQWRNLPIRHINLDAVELEVRHVPAENLVFWMSGEVPMADERTSNVVLSRRIALKGVPDRMSTTWIDVGQLIPEPAPGMYQLIIRYNETHDAARIVLTDLHLVAKREFRAPESKQGARVRVWALNVLDNRPVTGVDISLVRPSGQSVGRCTTDAEGGCVIEPAAGDADPVAPIALVATHGRDVTYLKFADVQTRAADVAIDGEPFVSATPYRAAMYSDRGVYRPGETAHLVAIVRDAAYQAPAAGLPVEISVVDSRQREKLRQVLASDAAGVVSLDLPLGDFAATGTYAAGVWVGKKLVQTYRFQVEEFVPERMRVDLRLPRSQSWIGEDAAAEVDARYLFGAPAAGSRVELSCRLEQSAFRPKANAQYTYGPWSEPSAAVQKLELGMAGATLDANGKALMRCPAVLRLGMFRSPGELVATAAVFESGGGRTSVAQARAPAHPERYYVGLRATQSEARAGQPLEIEGIVVNWDGEVVHDVEEVVLEMFQVHWQYGWYYDEERGEGSYERRTQLIKEGSKRVPVRQGRFRLPVTPSREGPAFVVRAESGAARTDLHVPMSGQMFWMPEESEAGTPKPLEPVPLRLEGPQALTVGKPVTVTFEAPYRGRVLLTAETHEVLTHAWKDVEAGRNSWTFELGTFVPNIYVSAFLLKDPHAESAQAFVPDRAYGMVAMQVQPERFAQNVRLEVPKEVRSQSRLGVTLQLGAVREPTVATVAVVDEGILSLTRFSAPDPLASLFARRALGVDTFETAGWILRMMAGGPSSATGGGDGELDGAGPGKGRVMPVRPVSLWSGVVAVPASGKLELAFDVPNYRGSLRVMAVTASATRIGVAQADVAVRDPIIVQTTAPRVLLHGDEVEVPVHVTNMSGSDRDIEVALRVSELATPGLAVGAGAGGGGPGVEVLGGGTRTLRVAQGASALAVFRLKAVQAFGAVGLEVSAASANLRVSEKLALPLAPRGSRERRIQTVALEAGTTDLRPYLAGWVPTTEQTSLWVTALPYAGSFEHLKYLVRYPFGCLEQVTSSTRPLLHIGAILRQVDPALAPDERTLGTMVKAGIDRLLTMRIPGGGFGYWPGSDEAHGWASAYATHLLLDARDQGHVVPARALEESLSYLERGLNIARGSASLRGSEEAYVQFVLARAGRGRKARLGQLVAELSAELKAVDKAPGKAAQRFDAGQLAENLYLVKAALFLAGDRTHEQDLRRPDFSLAQGRDTGGTFYSAQRHLALVAAIYLDLFGPDKGARTLIEGVAQSLGRTSAEYTTQELVWAVSALGKWAKGAATAFEPPELLADSRVVAPTMTAGKGGERTWLVPRASEYGELALRLASKSSGRLTLVISSEGVREVPGTRMPSTVAALSREFLTAQGQPLDVGAMALGDLVYVRLRVANRSALALENLALVDRLAAGWEIENPRLGRGVLPDWVNAEGLWPLDYLSVRDDRLELFGRLEPGQVAEYVYAVRAVSAGRFQGPSAELEAMYDPAIWAGASGSSVVIAGPWTETVP